MYMFLQFFFALLDNNQLKMRQAGPVTFYTTRASVWVPSDVDRIVRPPSNCQFFRQNHHIKNSFVWQCYFIASSAQLQWWRKQESKESNRFNKQNKNSAHAAHFLADFFAFITWKTLSNLIGNAIISSTLKIATVLIGPGIVVTSIVKNTHSEAQKILLPKKKIFKK